MPFPHRPNIEVAHRVINPIYCKMGIIKRMEMPAAPIPPHPPNNINQWLCSSFDTLTIEFCQFIAIGHRAFRQGKLGKTSIFSFKIFKIFRITLKFNKNHLQADQFIQSLSEKNRDAIKKFMEKEGPDEGECYLWVRDDVTMKVGEHGMIIGLNKIYLLSTFCWLYSEFFLGLLLWLYKDKLTQICASDIFVDK